MQRETPEVESVRQPSHFRLQLGASRINQFCPLGAALRENHKCPYAYLEGVLDERDPGARCEVKLRDVLNLRERLDDTLQIAHKELQKAQVRQKHYYDRTARRGKFCVDDKILILRTSCSCNSKFWRLSVLRITVSR
ncbi:hypothetical protein PoB_006563800 [Plakobranchus ocellatus]|uniref:Uncharacterized protein n=1 Tax=Plakobranchus ocellatus TaxID=259542 RepID=A0AAV4D4M1_9GAST|nr:hypothetical protein PoB_006563800 [Plakobranchus ocellatus]